jgi:peptide/nickel transport system substrate-binding protein
MMAIKSLLVRRFAGRPCPWKPAIAALLLPLLACLAREPEPGDTVTIATLPAVAVDPYLHSHLPTYGVLSHFYEPLVALDSSAAVVPGLAVSWENPSDTVWRLHLRRGVFFHDGRPLGAADVVSSLERARRMRGSEVAQTVRPVVGIRAIDGQTVEITTTRPVATLLAQLSFLPIVPRDTPLTPITRPVGTGPYRFLSGRPYGEFAGERFDRYWGPRPLFRRFHCVPVEGPEEQARWVLSGRADIATFVSPTLAGARSRPRGGIRVVRGRPFINFVLGLVERSPSPFSEAKLRRAVAAAIDRGRLALCDPDRILAPMPSLIPAGVFGSIPPASDRGPDPALARRLLAEAGRPQGMDVSLLLFEGDLSIGREIARELAPAGIRVALHALPRRDYFYKLGDEKDEIFLFNWVSSWGDAAELLDGFVHSAGGDYGAHNFLGGADPELDRLIERADRILEPSVRLPALEDAVRYAEKTLPVISLVEEARLVAIRRDLDFSPRADGILRAFDLVLRR